MDDHSITIEENSEPCISKVYVGLRDVKPKAYEPVLVSIGPYHRGNSNLQAMQQNKKLYLNSLLERTNKSPESHEIYLAKAKFDSEARKCYVDPVNCNDEFAEMMLLDGCFIVEFLRKMVKVVKFDKDDPIFRVEWMQDQILSDMMLLENQLPYFVLSKVYSMTKSDEGEKPLEEMVMSSFNFMLPRPRLNSINAFGNIGEINHLLHLIHVFCRPFPEKTIKNKEDSNSGSAKNGGREESSDDQTCCPLLPQNNNSGSDLLPVKKKKRYEIKNHMGTVVELQEAGIKFKKVGKIYNGKLTEEEDDGYVNLLATEDDIEDDDYVSLFDIDFKYEERKVPCFKCGVPCFKCGVMKVPCFKVEDRTETLLRNLIAYEQHFPNPKYPKYFTDFASLMNQLINSKEDAKVLRFKEIIMNFLGDDGELSLLFNRLTDGICESDMPYYLEVDQMVDDHCKTTWNVSMAKLRRDYFNNPWAAISTGAAIFLLFLTVVQTVVALITLIA